MRLTSLIALLFVVLSGAACAKRSHFTTRSSTVENRSASSTKRININTASANELEDLPGIGKGLAERIVEHREKYGRFTRPEHLIMVRGISERRFYALRDWITVE